MTELTIDQLPNEVLVEIFKFIDKSSLNNVALTCKKWKEISNEVPRKLKLGYRNRIRFDEDWAEELQTTQRRFNQVNIYEAHRWQENHVLEIFSNIGNFIQELHLINCAISSSEIFLEFLKSMPKLKRVIFSESEIFATVQDPTADELPDFTHLKTLEFVKSDYCLLKWFVKAKLSSFKVLCSNDGFVRRTQSLLEFLATKKSLKSLALRSITHRNSQLFKTPIDVEFIPFRLKKLSLVQFKLQTSPNDYNNLLTFLQVHAKSAEELEIDEKFPDFILEFIFSKFIKLKSLKITSKSIPKDLAVYERLEVNANVTKLNVTDETAGGSDAMKEFLRHLPNLNTLVLEYSPEAEVIAFISTFLTKLRCLDIGETRSCFHDLRFSSLEVLYCGAIYEDIDWSTFTANNPQIKELHIKSIDSETFDIEEITKNLKLRVLRIGPEDLFAVTQTFFDSIRRNCKELKLLSLHKDSLQGVEVSDVADIRPLRLFTENHLEFPDEIQGEFWDEKDYDGFLPHADVESLDGFSDMDPFEVQMMMEDLGLDDDDDNDWVDNDDYYDFYCREDEPYRNFDSDNDLSY